MQEILRKIGLTEGEAKVYLALLGLGQSSTGPIVRKSGVTTSKSYKILDRLEQKGLASHVYKKKIKHFTAANPHQVLELVKRKEEELQEQKQEVEQLLPDLIKYQKQVQEEHETEVYLGMEGLRTIFNQQTEELEAGEEHYVIGITRYEDYREDVAQFFKRLESRRAHKGIIGNFLLGENARNHMQYLENSQNTKIRYLQDASHVAINLHKDVTVIGIFIGSPILIKIKSKEVTNNFIKHFKLLWEQAKE